VTFE
jgi:hypothetical protein